jgi:hypothetical protein
MRSNVVKRVPGWSSWLAALMTALVLVTLQARAAQTVVYSTGFEVTEGYDPDYDLVGQNGWVGSGASGLVTNFFAGMGQQAYIGFLPPEGNTNEFLSVYRPINLASVPASQPLVKFSVLMQVVDSTSTNGPWDDFRWSVYTTNGVRLFSLDFDNASFNISYVLDDGAGFIPTGAKFDTKGFYELVIAMNFARNIWTATLNDEVVVNALPITTVGTPLSLGDIDAVWALRNPSAPGDNYMLFDDYTITLESVDSIPPRLEVLGMRPGGAYQVRLYGEPGLIYRVEASTDLVQWQTLMTFTAPQGGILDFQDSAAPSFARRFYRARQGQ